MRQPVGSGSERRQFCLCLVGLLPAQGPLCVTISTSELCLGSTFAGPVVRMEDVAKPAGAVVPANVVVAVVVTCQLLIAFLQALIHI